MNANRAFVELLNHAAAGSAPAERSGDGGVALNLALDPDLILRPARRIKIGIKIKNRIKTFAAALLVSLSPHFASHAQTPLSNLVFTVGTTIQHGANQHSYLVLNAPDAGLLAGKRFAVYGKTGYPDSANPFTLRGTMARQNDPAVVNTLLHQSLALGQDLVALDNALAHQVGTNVLGLLRNVPGITSQTLPQKVVTALQFAAGDPRISTVLPALEQVHPGFNLCAGRAFTEPISAVTTYELRELHPVTGVPGDVVGRVTVVPGVPVVLPAPGRPFQVTTNLPADHLLIRLRWGTPPELRRLALLGYGFNLWRIPRAAAEAANFHVTPPTVAQLHTHPGFTRANPAPAMATMELGAGSGPGHADDPNDRRTHFFADNGRATGEAFADGEEFYYFVTACDLLGRDGLASAGGLARACRRLPPPAPADLRVENTVLPGSTNQPRLHLFWEQNTNDAAAVTHYWIYRWVNPAAALTNDAAPLVGRVGVVTHTPGTNRNVFLDNTPGAFTNASPSNIWYTVRAVSEAACDPLLSPHSPPAWGVLRQRDAPAATTGEILGSCGTPAVRLQAFSTNSVEVELAVWRFRLTVERRDPGIAWVQFAITNASEEIERIGPVYFADDDDRAEVDYEVPADLATAITVGCTVGTFHDQVSRSAIAVLAPPFAYDEQREAVFLAGQVLATALSLNDPLVTALNAGASDCRAALNVTPDASGMVSMQFNFGTNPPVLVQAQTNGVWFEVAFVTPDAAGVYWVSYPDCLIGPLPPFRGCFVNAPAATDCPQHVAQAAEDAGGAPLRIRFRLTPRTREFRVYRRVDDGPLTLFAQGAAAYDPAKPGKLIESRDEAIPPSAARLCYYVQLLDEHGHGSPLAFVGCKESVPQKLPRPVLAEPQPLGDASSPQVLLKWFCPTAGVSRFEFKIRRVDPLPSGAATGITSTKLRVLTTFNPLATYLERGSRVARVFDEAQLTPPLGPEFGPGPQFALTANVVPNAQYEITVAAVDALGKARALSEVWPFTWRPPIELAEVPWPARPLPPVRTFEVRDRLPQYPLPVQAVVFPDDPLYPVGIRIGVFNLGYPNNSVGTNLATIFFSLGDNPDPHTAVFRRKSTVAGRAGESLLPIVAYRQQVTNAAFPRVSGSIVQVSPLVERIPWHFNPFGDVPAVTILDRLLGIRWDQQSYLYPLYLRDQQPVLSGARYRYFLVRFDARREPVEIIPAGEVTIP
jgi:hypothetical protein